jgi:hypothetical protein
MPKMNVTTFSAAAYPNGSSMYVGVKKVPKRWRLT